MFEFAFKIIGLLNDAVLWKSISLVQNICNILIRKNHKSEKYVSIGKHEVVRGHHPDQKWKGCNLFFSFKDEINYSRIQFLLPKVISEVCLVDVSNS